MTSACLLACLPAQHIVPVEGLDLTGLEPGHWYDLTCLPLNIQVSEPRP